ncbi:multidrug DMT transporter permease [Acidovorax sp. Leaf76]|uniref:DMT family transporter n=1 Tax=unclassified Acidovorax TaxID=2684926 RepID=UPI0006FE3AAB|nr:MULTISPECIES: DMT family transporter [unclassified Acidovorax]KQO15044.1 multidrug DMT transporter permease [Acidovorax sp. Leaf76]KQO31854.1 multidrug DMT transporter permease [Acidovorax sp. Leaf84]KQS28915.1 multidrug DMT transporter permease [Acidovorax sp. Leaf191]
MTTLTAPTRSPLAPRLADAALLLVAVVWGTSYGVAKGALVFYPVLGFLAVRFGLTFVLLLPALLRASRAEQRDALAAGLPLGGLLMGIFVCETFGLALTQASNAAFLISLCVVFTPFAEWALLGQRPARAMFVFAGVSLVGAALLSGGLNGHWGWGDALMLAAAVLRAITVCQTSRLTRRRNAPVLALTAVQAGVIALGSVALALALPGGLPPLPGDAGFWLACVYLVLGCTVFAFVVQNWALRHSSPSRVGLLMGSEPAFGALFAVLWLGESLSIAGWAGGALIVAAALWTMLRRGATAPN